MFQKGKPRPANAGRRAGTPNKKPFDLLEKLRALACDPFEFMALVVLDKVKDDKGKHVEASLKQRISCARELGKYILPHKKSIEVSGHIVVDETPAEALARATAHALGDNGSSGNGKPDTTTVN